MKFSKFGMAVVLPLLVCCLTGCGSKGPEIRGTVTLDGQPLPEARVTFEPASDIQLPSKFATTDAAGKFEIPLDEDTGATLPPGQYKVTVSKVVVREGAKVSPEMEGDMEQLKAMGMVRETVPARYTRTAETPLSAEIKSEPNDLKLELTSK